jgi:VWFA-related protein
VKADRYNRSFVALLVLGTLAIVLLAGPVEAAKKTKEQLENLPQKYKIWLASVDLLITKEERRAFLELEKDYQRDAFIERFWTFRDPYPQTTRNEFKERWINRSEEALSMFGRLDEARSSVYLLNGSPEARIEVKCTELWPIEVWYYRRSANAGEVLVMFFQKGGLGPFRLWYPTDGTDELMRYPGGDISSCGINDMDTLRAVFNFAQLQGGAMGFSTVMGSLLRTPEPPSGEWMGTFHAYSTEIPEDVEAVDAAVKIEYPGRHQSRTVVQGIISIDPEKAELSKLSEFGSYNFILTGEVVRDEKLFDSFRYQFNIPESDVKGEEFPLVFERYLRPGDYLLNLKLEDLNAKEFYLATKEISVPVVEHLKPVTPKDPETARILAEANAAISTGDTTIQIVQPQGQLQTGMLRVDTLTTGSDIDVVEFAIDGKPLFTKRTPPFSVEVDLGSLPRMRTLAAIAKDADGNELARDEMSLNTGAQRFDVRLIEPRRGQTFTNSLRAEAQVLVPEDKILERVEFYYNETLVATLYQPPFTQPILLPAQEELAYVRVVAYQPDDNSVEDSVFINAPDYMENLEIQFVELFIAVLDKQKHPVEGLEMGDFVVHEDGVQQEARRFDLVTNLPIHAGILLDISGSMEANLEIAQRAALQFFEEAVEPRDRAVLITFNDHPNLQVKFTNELEKLAGGLAGLKAERGTALYDSLIFALYYFNGIKGQRALIVLSDGKDEHSRFSFENTLEYAQRAGVAIYTIGLNIPKTGNARKKLNRIAEETGGRGFLIQSATEIPAIYEIIQRELRSRYYLAYQSGNTAEDTDFRTVDVEISRPGLEAKTMRGYYP